MRYEVNKNTEIIVYKREQEDKSIQLESEIRYIGANRGYKVTFTRSSICRDSQKLLDANPHISYIDIMCFCRFVEKNYDKIELLPYIKGIGWQFDENDKVSGYSGAIYFDSKGNKQPMNLQNMQIRGDLEKLKSFLASWIKDNVCRQSIYLVAVSSIICGLLKKNIIASIIGKSSSGKTTVSHLGISIFANPNSSETSIHFSDTDNFIFNSLNENKGIAVLIDDTSLNKEFIAPDFVYKLALGSERGRLNTNHSAITKKHWSTAVLLTAEHSILYAKNQDKNYGKVARLIEFNVDSDTLFDNVEQAEQAECICRENYGLIESVIVEYILKNGLAENIMQRYHDLLKKIRDQYELNDNIVNRLCQSIAIVALSADIATKALGITFDTDRIVGFLVDLVVKQKSTFECEAAENIKVSHLVHDIIGIAEGKCCEKIGDFLFIESKTFKEIILSLQEKYHFYKQSDAKALLKNYGYLKVNRGQYGFKKSGTYTDGYMINYEKE